MPFVAVLIGAIIIVAALKGTHGDLATALEKDIPGYFKWAAAIAAILGLGFVPGLRTPSRYLLALVLIVIVVKNYQAILAGFQNFAGTSSAGAGSGASPDPAAGYVASPTSLPTTSELYGDSGSGAPTGSAIAGGVPSGGASTSSFNPGVSSAGSAGNMFDLSQFSVAGVNAPL